MLRFGIRIQSRIVKCSYCASIFIVELSKSHKLILELDLNLSYAKDFLNLNSMVTWCIN